MEKMNLEQFIKVNFGLTPKQWYSCNETRFINHVLKAYERYEKAWSYMDPEEKGGER